MRNLSRTIRIVGVVLVAVALLYVAYLVGRSAGKRDGGITSVQKRALYSCPMHPSVTSDQPGQCPICHMDLQRIDGGQAAAPEKVEGSGKGKILFYQNPMNPKVTSPVPMKDEMGMDYVPVYSDENETSEASDVPGRAAFPLSPERQQLIGLTTAKVDMRDMGREVRASGQVAFDPDLFTAIEEYRQALNTRSQMGTDALGQIRSQADLLVKSSATKLRLMGLSEAQIKRLGDSRTDPMSLILPKGNVWIYAEVYEYELSGLKAGQRVTVESTAAPGKKFEGKLTSISPVLNPQTRTVRVRALVPDPEGVLRPDSYVNVVITQAIGKKLAVPSDSILHSGEKDYVFVVKGEGRFVPRLVTTGMKTSEWTEITSGLSEGETVATAANFLIDSESRLRSAAQETIAPTAKPKSSGTGGDR